MDFLTVVLLACAAFIIFLFIRWILESFEIDNLEKRAVLITGCDSGFGRALAIRCAQKGMPVFAGCLRFESFDELRELSKGCKTPIDAFILDVSSDQSVAKAKEYLERRTAEYGGLHGLVNNAGILGKEFFDEFLTLDDYKEVAEVNTWGVIRVTHAMSSLIKQTRGRIVTVTSVCSRLGIMCIGPYTTAKFAVAGYCDVIRQEMRLSGVSVHVIEPGFFKTNLTTTETINKQVKQLYDRCSEDEKLEGGYDFFKEVQEKMVGLLDFICSDRIDYVTDAYLHALTAVYPRSRYQAGWDAILIFIPFSMVPTAIQDLVMRIGAFLSGMPAPPVLRKGKDKTLSSRVVDSTSQSHAVEGNCEQLPLLEEMSSVSAPAEEDWLMPSIDESRDLLTTEAIKRTSASNLDDCEFLTRMATSSSRKNDYLISELRETEESFENNIRKAMALEREWREIRSDPSITGAAAGAKFVQLYSLHADATRTELQISRLGNRFVLTEIILRERITGQYQRDVHEEIHSIISRIGTYTDRIASTISQIEKDLQQAECDLKSEHCVVDMEQIKALFQETFGQLQRTVAQHSADLALLKGPMTQTSGTELAQPVDRLSDENAERMKAEVPDMEQLSDLISENSNEEDDPGKDLTDEDMDRLNNERVFYEDYINKLQDLVKRFPYRKYEQEAPTTNQPCVFCGGEHYHDSCLKIKKGDDRWDFAWDYGICKTCLDRDCEGEGRCPRAKKPCYYCARLQGTYFASMVFKMEHHSALCNIPDRKKEAKRKLEEARHELKRVEQLISRGMNAKKSPTAVAE